MSERCTIRCTDSWREYRDLLGTGRHSDPRSIGELVLGGDAEPTPAEPVEMHTIDGVRYRPEDLPEE